MKPLIIIILISLIISCNIEKKESPNIKKNKRIAAYINDSIITLSDLDNTTQQEIYDELNRIYLIRKTALHYMIEDKLIENEARKKNISKKIFLQNYYVSHFSDSLLNKFIKFNKLEKGIVNLKQTLEYIDIKSNEGKVLLEKEFNKFLRQYLIDSLKQANNIKIKLSPPQAPTLAINNINVHYRGNINSKVSLITISDFECDRCSEHYFISEQLFEKYKDKVKFGFANYSGYVTLSALASECAAKQNDFFGFYNELFSLEQLADSTKIFQIAKDLKLDISRFKKDMNDSIISKNIEKDFEKISSIGVYATPTVLINNKVIFNSNSIEEIEAAITNELSK